MESNGSKTQVLKNRFKQHFSDQLDHVRLLAPFEWRIALFRQGIDTDVLHDMPKNVPNPMPGEINEFIPVTGYSRLTVYWSSDNSNYYELRYGTPDPVISWPEAAYIGIIAKVLEEPEEWELWFWDEILDIEGNITTIQVVGGGPSAVIPYAGVSIHHT